MYEPINNTWVRVTDPSVEPYREFNVPADAVSDGLKVLKGKPTHNLDGSPIPVKATPAALVRSDDKEPTVKDLQAEIDSRNEGREEADLIVPEGSKKADLQAALEADNASTLVEPHPESLAGNESGSPAANTTKES